MNFKIILTESQLKNIVNKILIESNSFDSEVEDVQNYLKHGYNLGKFGSNKDGVDGKLGGLTKKAMVSAMKKDPSLKEKYTKLLKKHGYNIKDDSIKKVDLDVKTDLNVKSDSDVVILMGGLDYREGDFKINKQIEMLGISNKKVIGHRYNEINSVIDSIKKYPNAIVVLFSAGCRYSNKISEIIGNKNNLYIVEPYGLGSSTKNSVQSAITNGVPQSNVITGPTLGRGLDIVSNSTKTPKNKNHWGSLGFVGSLIS